MKNLFNINFWKNALYSNLIFFAIAFVLNFFFNDGQNTGGDWLTNHDFPAYWWMIGSFYSGVVSLVVFLMLKFSGKK